MKKGTLVMAMAFVAAAVCVEIGCGCAATAVEAQEKPAAAKPVQAKADSEGPTCSLSKKELAQRRALARDVLGGALVGWKKVEGGTLLRLKAEGVEKAMKLVMLERRCCVGVGAVLTLGADSDNADLVLEGPAFFEAELSKMLVKAPKIVE